MAATSDPQDVTPPRIDMASYVAPKYPEDARKNGVEGRVLLDVVVASDGTVAKVTVKEGVDGYVSFEKAAMKAVEQWRFHPATANGDPVQMQVVLPVKFKLDSNRHGDGTKSSSKSEKSAKTLKANDDES